MHKNKRKTVVLLLLIAQIYVIPNVYALTISGSMNSSTWAGYLASAVGYFPGAPTPPSVTAINGSWIVQVATKPIPSFGSQWVGIGGVGGSLVQIGTFSDYGLNQSYGAFYETVQTVYGFPLPLQFATTINGFSVSPEDKIFSSISLTNGETLNQCESNYCNWLLVIKDSSRNETWSKTVNFDPNMSYADWIEESAQAGFTLPLSHFGVTKFGLASTGIQNTDYATINSISNSIGNNSNIKLTLRSWFANANTSELSSGGTSFIVYEGPALEMVGGLNVSRSMLDLGQEAAINGPHAEGGSGNYTYLV